MRSLLQRMWKHWFLSLLIGALLIYTQIYVRFFQDKWEPAFLAELEQTIIEDLGPGSMYCFGDFNGYRWVIEKNFKGEHRKRPWPAHRYCRGRPYQDALTVKAYDIEAKHRYGSRRPARTIEKSYTLNPVMHQLQDELRKIFIDHAEQGYSSRFCFEHDVGNTEPVLYFYFLGGNGMIEEAAFVPGPQTCENAARFFFGDEAKRARPPGIKRVVEELRERGVIGQNGLIEYKQVGN